MKMCLKMFPVTEDVDFSDSMLIKHARNWNIGLEFLAPDKSENVNGYVKSQHGPCGLDSRVQGHSCCIKSKFT